LRRRGLPRQLHGLGRAVESRLVDLGIRGAVRLAALHEMSPSSEWVVRAALGPPTGLLVRPSAGDVDAHGAGGAGDDLLGLLERVGVEVRHLGLRDLTELVARDAADLGLVRLAAALVHPGGLLDELRGRRRLGDEAERPVLVDADLYGDDVAAL